MKNVSEVEVKLEKEWVKALDDTFKKKNKNVSIDGFRKGSAPKEVYIKNFGIESLYMDAIDSCINIAYKKVLNDNKLEPVVEPKVDVLDVNEKSVTFKFVIISKPEVKLGEYKNLGIKKTKAKVSDEEINDEIEHLRFHMADMVVKENEKIVNGDTAIIDFVGFIDGKEVEGTKGENYSLEIGSHSFIPGFEEGLIGLKAGDKKDLNLKFPKEYVENLSGKDVLFKVKINEVKTRVLPDINEEFYKDLGYDDIKTLDELKAKIKAELMEDKEAELKDKFIEECLEKAAKNMKVEINPEIIDNEVKAIIEQYFRQFNIPNFNIDEFNKTTGKAKDELYKSALPEAEKRIKYRYLLETIAETEKLDFSEEEVKQRAEEMAKHYGITSEELIRTYGSLDVVKYDLKMKKALEILEENN